MLDSLLNKHKKNQNSISNTNQVNKLFTIDLKTEKSANKENEIKEIRDSKIQKQVNTNSSNLNSNLNSNSNQKKQKQASSTTKNTLDEEKLEEEYEEIFKKNEEIMNKYCSLYNKPNNSFLSSLQIEPLNNDYLKKKQNKIEHTRTTGKDWFNMKAPEMTPEVENDLKAIQLRHIIDPRRFYKKQDVDGLPRFFQIGTLEVPILTGKRFIKKKSEIKNTLVEEFLEDDANIDYSRRKFGEIQANKSKQGRKKAKMNEYKMKNKSKYKKNSNYISK